MKRRRSIEEYVAQCLSVLLLCLHDDDPEDLRYLRGDPAVLRSTLNSDDILSTNKLTNALYT